MPGPANLRAFAGEIDVEVHTEHGWVPAKALAVLRTGDCYEVLVDRGDPTDPRVAGAPSDPADPCTRLVWVPRARVRIDNPPGY